MKEDENCTPKFIEVNPRFGGGTYFSSLAGVNFAQIIVENLRGKISKISSPKNITMLRYFNEIICDF